MEFTLTELLFKMYKIDRQDRQYFLLNTKLRLDTNNHPRVCPFKCPQTSSNNEKHKGYRDSVRSYLRYSKTMFVFNRTLQLTLHSCKILFWIIHVVFQIQSSKYINLKSFRLYRYTDKSYEHKLWVIKIDSIAIKLIRVCICFDKKVS